MKIRKQVYDLDPVDLARFPVWEFALDEETEAGQDEATVRPWEGTGPLDPGDGMFVVRATFVLADGAEHTGFLTPPVRGEASLSAVQPVIVTGEGQVMFWFGVMAPRLEAIRSAYEKLGRTVEAVFPCRYASAVPLKSGPVTGTVSGFMHYRSFRDRTVVEVR